MNRQEQKRKTRHAIINAAFNLLSEERSLSNISLREVTREAGIAPTSFYRHFSDMDELGLTLVDEGGLALRQLMRQARQRIEKGGDVIRVSVHTFLEFVSANSNAFRLLLRERSGTSLAFRDAVAREIKHFTLELTDYIETHTGLSEVVSALQADAMVKLVFAAGADAIDMDKAQRDTLAQHLVQQLRMIAIGAKAMK